MAHADPQRSNAPLLVLGACQRTGSTLLQRLLSSHDDVFIFGEHRGLLHDVLRGLNQMEEWYEVFKTANESWNQLGTGSFMANLSPSASVVRRSSIQLVESLFSADPNGTAVGRWGFKEVRYGIDFFEGFRLLFPQTTTTFLVRDPVDVAISLASWANDDTPSWRPEWTEEALTTWVSTVSGFTSVENDSVLIARYEDLVARPSETIRQIATHHGLDPDKIDMSIMSERVHGRGPTERGPTSKLSRSELTGFVAEFVDRADVAELATTLGYEHHRR